MGEANKNLDKLGQFKPGMLKVEGSGTKVGHKFTKTKQWEAIGEYLVDGGSKRYLGILNGMDDKEFVQEFRKIIEYFRPKLARNTTELTTKEPLQIQITERPPDTMDITPSEASAIEDASIIPDIDNTEEYEEKLIAKAEEAARPLDFNFTQPKSEAEQEPDDIT